MLTVVSGDGVLPQLPSNPKLSMSVGQGRGGAAILHNNDLEGMFNNPLGMLDNIIFSSWHFDYFSCRKIVTTTINLPERLSPWASVAGNGAGYFKGTPGYTITANLHGAQDYLIDTHNYGYTPIAIGFLPNQKRAFSSSTFFTYGDSIRSLTVVVNSSNIWINEQYYVGATSLPAEALPVKIMLMDQGIGSSYLNRYASQVYVTPSRVILGGGRIDSDRSYVLDAPNDPEAFKWNVSPSINLYFKFTTRILGYGFSSARLVLKENGNIIQSVSGGDNDGSGWSGEEWPGSFVVAEGLTRGIKYT